MKTGDYVPEYCLKPILILGCGNILRGDDGFGPQVIENLRVGYPIPARVTLLDAGTGVEEILLDIALFPRKPEKIVLVDTMDRGLPAGSISKLQLKNLPKTERKYFSIHQEPTLSLLRELEDLGVEVILIIVQPASIPDSVKMGLSIPVQRATSQVCQIIVNDFFNPYEMIVI